MTAVRGDQRQPFITTKVAVITTTNVAQHSSDAAFAYSLRVTTGVAAATWVPVVLVHRPCIFWLPLISGSFLHHQRREAL